MAHSAAKSPRLDSPDEESDEASRSSTSSVEDAELEAVAAASAAAGGARSRRRGPRSKRRSSRVGSRHSRHPAAGLQEDLERFLRAFTDAGAARFTAFSELFRSSRMSVIFYGRESVERLADFVQCLQHLLILYTQPPHQTLIRIGAVYLLYAYYVKLVGMLNAPIRVSLSQWQRLAELRHQLTQEGHCDALYCLRYLELRGAFLLCAQPLPCYPGAPPALCSAAEAARTRLAGESEPLRHLLGEERMDTLKALHAQYGSLKALLAARVPALHVVDEAAVERVERACRAGELKTDL